MSISLIILECTFYFSALFAGIIAFRSISLFYRLIFLQVCLNLVNYVTAYAITIYNRHNGTHSTENNHWLFNTYTFFECSILLAAGMTQFAGKRKKLYLFIGYTGFCLIFLCQIFVNGYSSFANYAACFEGILLVSIYLMILYRQLITNSNFLNPYLWLCLGIILYFSCIVPYLSMMFYLGTKHEQLNATLYQYIILGFENLRYLLVAISFCLCYKKSVTPMTLQNE